MKRVKFTLRLHHTNSPVLHNELATHTWHWQFLAVACMWLTYCSVIHREAVAYRLDYKLRVPGARNKILTTRFLDCVGLCVSLCQNSACRNSTCRWSKSHYVSLIAVEALTAATPTASAPTTNSVTLGKDPQKPLP